MERRASEPSRFNETILNWQFLPARKLNESKGTSIVIFGLELLHVSKIQHSNAISKNRWWRSIRICGVRCCVYVCTRAHQIE